MPPARGAKPELLRLLTVAKAAAYLCRVPETLRRAIRAGRLACYRIDGRIRITPDQIAACYGDHLSPAREPGASFWGKEPPDAALRQEQRARRAFDKAARLRKPGLRVVH